MSTTYGRASVPGARPSGRATVPSAPDSGGRGSGGRGGPPDDLPPALVARSRRRRWPRRLLAITLSLLLVVALALVGGFFYLRGLENNMARVVAFAPITADRPDKPVPRSLNVLVLGSDSRDPEGSDDDVYRADTLMLLHVPASRDQGYVISIPRDLWVYVPPNADGSAGGHEAKINAATAFGGVPLAVQAVESYTGVRVDRVMMVDFGGFVEVTDALGGVEMDIEQTIQSIHGEKRVFEEGRQQLNGEEALDYIRQRYQFADGDFTRMRNQQQFLKALIDKAASGGTLTNPGKLNGFLQTATRTLTVDEEFSLISVGWQIRNLRGHNLTFLTSPHTGTGTVGNESVVFSDDEQAAGLYQAVRSDRMAQWAAEHPDRVGA